MELESKMIDIEERSHATKKELDDRIVELTQLKINKQEILRESDDMKIDIKSLKEEIDRLIGALNIKEDEIKTLQNTIMR